MAILTETMPKFGKSKSPFSILYKNVTLTINSIVNYGYHQLTLCQFEYTVVIFVFQLSDAGDIIMI